MEHLDNNLVAAISAGIVAAVAFLYRVGKGVFIPSGKEAACWERMANTLDDIRETQKEQNSHIIKMSNDIAEIKGRLS